MAVRPFNEVPVGYRVGLGGMSVCSSIRVTELTGGRALLLCVRRISREGRGGGTLFEVDFA